MTRKEKDECLIHAQAVLRIAFGFAPSRNKIILLEASSQDGFINYVLFRVGSHYFRKTAGFQLEFVDEIGFRLAYVPCV